MPFSSSTSPLTLASLAALLRGDEPVRLAPEAEQRPAAGPTEALATPYLPATGLVPPANMLLAFAAGTGPELPAPLVRRLLLLKAYRLSQGSYQVAPALVRRLLDFFNRDVWPVVYASGAGSPAGDPVPLAHLCLPLLGLGEVNYQGYRLAAADVLGLFGWEPLALASPQERVLLSGNEVELAYATEALDRAAHLLPAADAIGALSGEVYGATPAVPTHWLAGSQLPGQPWAAAPLDSDEARAAFAEPGPVHRAALAHAQQVVENDLTTDAGPEPVVPSHPAAALGHLARALAKLGLRSALRVAALLAGQRQLPRYLAAEPARMVGLLALPHVAASLVHQARPDGPYSAVEVLQLVENTEQLLGIELLAAGQALDLRRPARSSAALEAVVAAFREHITFVAHDRILAPDLHRAARFVREYAWP